MQQLATSSDRRRTLCAACCAWAAILLHAAGETSAWGGPTPVDPPRWSDANASATVDGTYPAGSHLRSDRPHPAVARIIVPEGNAISFGSGTLVDVRDQFGLVVTNWHVVRDGTGDVEVVFPDGFRSKARPLKVDRDWDLAALVIWRPPTPPVPISATAPKPGDRLTICGYGQGRYRAATGRCTQYYAPRLELPQHMVELDVEARQGDSGGPIFNEQGELAGVLFGAGGGTTLGSFGGRVGSFLATLAPDIGRAADEALVQAPRAVDPRAAEPPTGGPRMAGKPACNGPDSSCPACQTCVTPPLVAPAKPRGEVAPGQPPGVSVANRLGERDDWGGVTAVAAVAPAGANEPPSPTPWHEQAKNLLAGVGAVALAMQVLRLVR